MRARSVEGSASASTGGGSCATGRLCLSRGDCASAGEVVGVPLWVIVLQLLLGWATQYGGQV